MNITDQIESLFKRGVVSLDIGKVPNGEEFYVKAGHVLPTGPEPDHMQVTHQVVGPVAHCLEGISKQVDHVNQLKPTIVQIRSKGRG